MQDPSNIRLPIRLKFRNEWNDSILGNLGSSMINVANNVKTPHIEYQHTVFGGV